MNATNAGPQATATEPVEIFLSDIHGEHRAFSHILRNGCGRIRQAIDDLFPDMTEEERADLAALAYYPTERSAQLSSENAGNDAWMADAIDKLAAVLEGFGFTWSGNEKPCRSELERLAAAIQKASISRLHLIGDIYDRGPAPDLIMDELEIFHDVDIQWGNHDIVWMGASLGQRGCVANVVRICARYGNLSILEDTYGIDLSGLSAFALKAYADDPCAAFGLKSNPDGGEAERQRSIKIQKAMSVIQFKVEAAHIADNPSFGLESRNLLHMIDYEKGTVTVDGIEHPLLDTVFPTVDPADPYRLTDEEEQAIAELCEAFRTCERLQRHMRVFLDRGSLYRADGNTLMFHACVPLNADGTLKQVTLYGETLSGKSLFDAVDRHVRAAFQATDPESKKRGMDLLWYLWLGEGSPLFAKSKMATFELYLIADKAARKEVKNPFYTLYENEQVLDAIFTDFGMDPATSHIVCGHVPVKIKDGENPLKCGGKVIVVDGGMSEAYQKTTGIAGLALRRENGELSLAELTPVPCIDEAICGNMDIQPNFRPVNASFIPFYEAR